MGKPKKTERLKDLLLVVLFFSTMLLLYFFWDSPMETFKLPEIIPDEEEVAEAPSFHEVTLPVEIIVNFGSGVYTVLNNNEYDAWNRCLAAVNSVGREEAFAVESITKEQYDRIMEFRSIRFEFAYDIPFDSFCINYQIKNIQNPEQIKIFNKIGYSAGSGESIFICDETNGRYYRLISDVNQASMEVLISEIEAKGFINYYPLGTVVGTGSKTAVPLSVETGLSEIEYEPEFTTQDAEILREFAQTFFGESFDFVRRIEESKGTIIYMYGYGQKILTVSSDGNVEYKEKAIASGVQQDYFTALNSALQFVASHGGWSSFNGTEMAPYVKYASAIEKEKKKGYRYIFGMEINGEKLFYEDSEIIVVEIFGGQITYYTRKMISVDSAAIEQQGLQTEREAFSAVNMIAQNYKYLHAVLSNEGYEFKETGEEGLFEAVSNLIEYVEIGYVKLVPNYTMNDELIPAWIVMIDGMTVYFDLYDAKPLGYTLFRHP